MAGFIACSELRIIDGMNKRSPLRSAAYRCSVRAIGFAKLGGSLAIDFRRERRIKTDNNQRRLLIPRRREFNGTVAPRNDPANVELLRFVWTCTCSKLTTHLVSFEPTRFHCPLAFSDYVRITLRDHHSHHCCWFSGPVQVLLHEHRSMIERQVDFVNRIPVKETAIRRPESSHRKKWKPISLIMNFWWLQWCLKREYVRLHSAWSSHWHWWIRSFLVFFFTKFCFWENDQNATFACYTVIQSKY